MRLTEEAKKAIRHSSTIRAKIMLAGNVSEYTVKRWLEEDNDELTKPLYTNILLAETELLLESILEVTETIK